MLALYIISAVFVCLLFPLFIILAIANDEQNEPLSKYFALTGALCGFLGFLGILISIGMKLFSV